MAAFPTASSSSTPAAAAAVAKATDGPVLSVVSKRLRALRRKLKHITQTEDSLAAGKTLNRDQEELLRSKPTITALIKELERLRGPLASAVGEEVASRPASNSDSDSDSYVQDLLALVYFGSLFDVKQQHDFAATMAARTYERDCCIAYDHVTDDTTAADMLAEADLDAVSALASLAVSRPVVASAAGVSHRDALQACAHHARLWLRRADEPIHPDSTITYAGVREKLEKINSLDYHTAQSDIKAAEAFAAAVWNCGAGAVQAQESTVVSPQAPEAAEESLAVEGHKQAKSPPSKDDVQGDDGGEPSTQVQVRRGVPCGHRQVQLFRVRTNFTVSTINIYDGCQGQTIYVSNNHQEVGRDLVLIGPRRPIDAYGAIAIEAFPLGSGRDGRLIENWDPYDSDEDDDEPRICVQRIDQGSSRMIEVTYLFIPNTIEAEIRVEVLPDPEVLGAYGSGVVSGTIKAWASDYGRHRVRLFTNFTEPRLITWPGIVFNLPLEPSVVCLPYRPHLQLYIEVDLLVEYGQQKVSRIISNLKFTHRVFERLAEEVNDHRIEVSVWMDPGPARIRID